MALLRSRFGASRRLLAAVVFAVAAERLAAQPHSPGEYQIKAVFLYNFAHFVDWPPPAEPRGNQAFCIGILGEDPFGSALDRAVRGESVNGHPLSVRRFRSVDEVEGCQMLFVSRSEAWRMDRVLRRLQGRSILVVSDADNFALDGGMIQFVTENNKVRLRINVLAARAAKLAISSKLLRPSEIVAPEGGQS
ncbi:MAG TPA: YfiR family protein [Opitutaceae bacterium]|jgi:hypothetical protein|nr:YfiR family protein [Opitutaceae bacterium]